LKHQRQRPISKAVRTKEIKLKQLNRRPTKLFYLRCADNFYSTVFSTHTESAGAILVSALIGKSLLLADHSNGA